MQDLYGQFQETPQPMPLQLRLGNEGNLLPQQKSSLDKMLSEIYRVMDIGGELLVIETQFQGQKVQPIRRGLKYVTPESVAEHFREYFGDNVQVFKARDKYALICKKSE